MPLIRKWVRMSPAAQYALALMVSVLLLGGAVIAILGLVASRAANANAAAAAVRAHDVATCVNSVLKTRNGPSENDTHAHIDFLEAMKTAEVVLFSADTRAEKQAAGLELIRATNAAVTILIRDQRIRDRHPFGDCLRGGDNPKGP